MYSILEQVFPEGIRRQINWLKQQYGDVEILITESGYCDAEDTIDDDRVEYYKEYLKQVIATGGQINKIDKTIS